MVSHSYGSIDQKQQQEIDSLGTVVSNAVSELEVLQALMAWDELITSTDPEKDIELLTKIDSLADQNLRRRLSDADKAAYSEAKAYALHGFGIYYCGTGDYPAAQRYLKRCLSIREALNDPLDVASTNNTIGAVLLAKGEEEQALESFERALVVFRQHNNNTGIIASLTSLGNAYNATGDHEKGLAYYNQVLELSQKLGLKPLLAVTLSNIGEVYVDQGFQTKALGYLEGSLKLQEEIGNDKVIAKALDQIGRVYKLQGDYTQAIAYYNRSLSIYQKLGARSGIANALRHIGNIYQITGDFKRALKNYNEGLTTLQGYGHNTLICEVLNDIGSVYQKQGFYVKAMQNYTRSLEIATEANSNAEMAIALSSIGSIYTEQADFPKATEAYLQSMKIQEKMSNKSGLAQILYNIGKNYKWEGSYSNAIRYAKRSLKVAEDLGSIEAINRASKLLWECYKEVGRYKSALGMLEQYMSTRDSIASDRNQAAVVRQEFKERYDEQLAEDSIRAENEKKVQQAMLDAEKAKKKQIQLESAQRKLQTYFLFTGLAIMLILGGFLFNRFRVTSRQKEIIEEQKQRVDRAYDQMEQKNQEILDSINSAKRIQTAILPPKALVKEYLRDSFILYKPKDIVAGDFYWMEPQQDRVFFAAADCTGHGVPGALVSIVCNHGLNQSVREYGLTKPGEILDKTREIVLQEFEKSEEDVKDGMDIALCVLEGNTLHYAGAHNPLWIIRKGASEIEEIKAHNQPIGKFDFPKPYASHTIELLPGDTFYIFSDGYADQFGGVKGKKFKSSKFKKLLLSVQDKPMKEQYQRVNDAFEDWKGPLEQLDDVCVIGVRV